MKRNLLAIILLITASALTAQTTFYKQFSFPSQANIGCAIRTSNGGYIITGIGPGNKLYAVRTNSFGDTLWTKVYSTTWAYANVIQTSDGGYLFTSNEGIFKTNNGGDISWAKQTTGLSGPFVIRQTDDGGYIMAGGFLGRYLGKLDDNGDLIWNKFYNIYWTNGGGQGGIEDIRQTADGGYIIAGYTYMHGAGGGDFCLTKTDASGNSIWSKTYGGTGHDIARCVNQTPDGGYIISGSTESFGAGNWDAYVVRTDDTGNLLWSKTYGGNQEDFGTTIQRTIDNGYIICGPSLSFAGGPANKVCLIKTDSAGAVNWSYSYIYNANVDHATAMQTPDGGYIVGSSSGGTLGGLILMKTDPSGNIGNNCYKYPAAIIDSVPATQVTSPLDTVYDVPDTMIAFSVGETSGASISPPCTTTVTQEIETGKFKVYPNPVINSLTIEVSEHNFLQCITMYSTDGRCVKSIAIPENNSINGQFSSINVDMKDLDQGIYFLDFVGEQGSEIVKVMKY